MSGRKHIPYKQRYAAALAEQLHPDVRAEMQKRRASADEVEQWFVLDHNITVRTKEIVQWWNINLFRKDRPKDLNAPAHVKKTSRDAKVHAKADRHERLRLTGSKKTAAQKKRYRPIPKGQKLPTGRKIPSRKFEGKPRG